MLVESKTTWAGRKMVGKDPTGLPTTAYREGEKMRRDKMNFGLL